MSIVDKLTTIAENEQKVFEAGKNAEYNEFWDSLQKNGEEFISYGNMFSCGAIWTQEHIEKVKYKNLKATYFSVVFNGNTQITDLSAFSVKITSDKNDVWKIPWSNTFSGCINLVKSPLIHLGEMSTTINCFANCTALEELQTHYDPSIEKGYLTVSFDLHWSTKLNKKSIVDLINAASPTQTGQTLTFALAAVAKAFETEIEENNGAVSDEWAALIATKPNWTISLI